MFRWTPSAYSSWTRSSRESWKTGSCTSERKRYNWTLSSSFFFYGLANVLLVNSVSTINTAPGEARVEEKLFFFVTCLLPKFGVCRNFVISLQLSSRRSWKKRRGQSVSLLSDWWVSGFNFNLPQNFDLSFMAHAAVSFPAVSTK